MPIAAATVLAAGLPAMSPQARADLHNITYRARIDALTTGSQAIFVTGAGRTSSTNLPSMPGNAFEANAVLPDPKQAGMQIVLRWPYSANVHCEIDVDDAVFTQVDRRVTPAPSGGDPASGILQCGATPDRLGLPSG
jgi:hypothetical protein